MPDNGTRPLESVGPRPLDYAELEKAAEAVANDIEQSTGWLEDYELILAALTAIAKRALTQAAVLLCNAHAALDAPAKEPVDSATE